MKAEIKLTDVYLSFKEFKSTDFSIRSFMVKKMLSCLGKAPADAVDDSKLVTLNGINLHLESGTKLGLVGRNGAGKSTLLRVMSGIYTPTSGKVEVNGRVTTLLNSGFSANSDLTGLENIKLGCALLRIPSNQLKTTIEEIIDFSELEKSIMEPVSTYSDGMKARLSFSIVTSVEPDVLLMDEAIGAVDKGFIEKAMRRVNKLVEASSILVMATHDENIMRSICNKVAVIKAGKIAAYGDTAELLGDSQEAA